MVNIELPAPPPGSHHKTASEKVGVKDSVDSQCKQYTGWSRDSPHTIGVVLQYDTVSCGVCGAVVLSHYSSCSQQPLSAVDRELRAGLCTCTTHASYDNHLHLHVVTYNGQCSRGNPLTSNEVLQLNIIIILFTSP